MRASASMFGAVLLLACGNGDATTVGLDASAPGADGAVATDAGVDAAHDASFDAAPSEDAGDASDATNDANTATGFVRFAHLSPNAAPLDVCIAANGGSFAQSKPIFGSALPSGLAFLAVTVYRAVPAGTYAVRFVAAGASDCLTAVGNATLSPLNVGDKSYASVLARGDASALGAVSFADDPPYAAHLDGGANAYSAVRVVNEATGVASIDVGRGSLAGSDFAVLWPAVGVDGKAAPNAASGIDALGYMNPIELQGDTLSAHASGGAQDLAVWPNVVVDLGEVATLFVVPGTQAGAVRSLLCARDFAAPPNAVLNATCAVMAQ